MASNPTPESGDVCAALIEDICDGLLTYEVSLNVKQNTKVVLEAALAAYTAAENTYALAKANRASKATLVATADREGAAWLTKAAKVLRISLGERWNSQWEPTHFPDNSTQVPTSQDKRFTLLGKLATYFTNNAGQEAANQGVTALAATGHHTAVSDARDTLNQAETAQKTAKTPRDAALVALRKRIRSFIDELIVLLPADDPRWEAFGLTIPANPRPPTPATNFTAEPAGPGNILFKWKRGTRSTYHRLFYKVLTIDTDFKQHTPNPAGLSETLENLPTGLTLQAYLIAANEAGDAAATETISVVAP